MKTPDLTVTIGDATRAPNEGHAIVKHLYLALECDRPSSLSVRFSLADVSRIEIGRGTARAWDKSPVDGLRIDVPDRHMSSSHATLRREADGSWVLEDCGSKNGTLVNGTRTPRAVLDDGDLVELGHTLFLFRGASVKLGEDPEVLDISASAKADGVRTLVPSLARQFADVAKLAPSTIPILILGETGTGKEVVARAIHALSGRPGAFVAVNCGALPQNLVESELFGSRKGAFSGATEDRLGLVRASDTGTLLLDEIGDLPVVPQAVLLRTLQEGEVLPVGAARPVPVDLRVLSATHHEIESLVERKRFRTDLYARLNGFTLRMPALRERVEDLGLLVGTILERATPPGAAPVTLSTDAGRALFDYPWPLNIRELEKCLRSAVVLSGGKPIELEHLPDSIRKSPKGHSRGRASTPSATPSPASKLRPLRGPDDIEARDLLLSHLKEHNGNISAVARAMGKARMQIHRWIRQYGIDMDQFRG